MVEDLTPEDLQKAGELEKFSAQLRADFDRSREYETSAINEFEKTLWLVSSGGATITIGFLTSAAEPERMMAWGSISFVLSVLSLLIMKAVSAINASRDRARRQRISDELFTQNKPIKSLMEIRDKTFKWWRNVYLGCQVTAVILFLVGCAFTLASVYPTETHNKALKAQPSAAADAASGAP